MKHTRPHLLLALLAPTGAAAQSQIDPTPRELVPNVFVAPLDIDGDGHTELLGTGFDRILRAYHADDAGRLIDARDLAPPCAGNPCRGAGLVRLR